MFRYKVEFYDEIDEEKKIQSGFVIGEDYSQAIENLCKWFGEENIINILTLYPLEDISVYDDEELKEIIGE